MTRAFVAVSQPDERHSLRLMLLDLGIEVSGEADDWATASAQVPRMQSDMLLTEWDLLPSDAATAMAALRAACPSPIVVVLISQLEARQQAALSAGADSFISKGERTSSVAEHLRMAAAGKPATIRKVKETTMNDDIAAGKWKEMRGQVKEWWGDITDDELDQAAGKSEQMIGLLQQKYGYTRERAESEYNGRIKSMDTHGIQDKLAVNDDIVAGKWKSMRGQVKEWWGKLTDDELDQAEGKAEQMIGLLQQKYGYTRERAQDEYNRRLKAVDAYKDTIDD